MRALRDFDTPVLAAAATRLAVQGREMELPVEGESAFDADVRRCVASATREAGNRLDARFAHHFKAEAEQLTCPKCRRLGPDYFKGKSPPACPRCG